MKKIDSKIKNMTYCSLAAALICVLSPISFPIGAIPVTLSLFAVMLAALVLDFPFSLVSVVLYVVLGAVGLPVFSGGRGGFGVISGATGGYIVGYVFVPTAVFVWRKVANKFGIFSRVFSCMAGVLACYAAGTVWYSHVTGTGFFSALLVCALPFIPFDVLKAFFAAILSVKLEKYKK